jgi:integrase
MSLKGSQTRADYLPWDDAQTIIGGLFNDEKYIWGVLIAVGIYTGLRISDILALKWNQVYANDYITIKEKKTGKVRKIKIHPNLKDLLKTIYDSEFEHISIGNYIFHNKYRKKMSVQYINRILKQIALDYNINAKHFTTHSFRKTFGRRIWEINNYSEKSLIMLNKIFNHTSIETTRIYLGIQEEEIDLVYDSLESIYTNG